MKKKNEVPKRKSAKDDGKDDGKEKGKEVKVEVEEKKVVLPLTQNFGSDELHALRDKINELIQFLS